MRWKAFPKSLYTWKCVEGAAPSLAQDIEKSGVGSVPQASPQKQASQTSVQWDKCVDKPGQLESGSASGKDAGISWITFLHLDLLHFCEGPEKGLTASELSLNFMSLGSVRA